MPITPPSYIDRVNFISFFLSNPCSFPWIVYFETLGGVIGRLVWSLLEFDMGDVIRSLFRPGGGRQRRHRQRRRRPGRKALIPEIADLIAARIPGQEMRTGRQVSDGVRHLWRIDGVAQRGLYYLLLFDIVLEFWVEWQSAIIRDPRSRCEGVARALRENTNHVANSGGWGQLLFPDLRYSEGPIVLSNGGAQSFGGKFLCTIACKARPWIPDPAGVQAQIAIRHFASGEFLDASSRVTLFPGQTADLVATVTLQEAFHIFFAEYAWNNGPFNGGVEYYDMSAFIMQMGE